jgi:hypothetical protein
VNSVRDILFENLLNRDSVAEEQDVNDVNINQELEDGGQQELQELEEPELMPEQFHLEQQFAELQIVSAEEPNRVIGELILFSMCPLREII